MTKCEIFIEETKDSMNERITGFRISGHSGFDKAGADIVCSAVSATVIMAEAIINDECNAKAKVREREGSISLTLPAICEREECIQAVLSGMVNTLLYLRDEYPDNIEVVQN